MKLFLLAKRSSIRKMRCFLSALCFSIILIKADKINAQVSLSSSVYTQNFDGIVGTALPQGWQVNFTGTADRTATALNSTSSGGSYIFISNTDKAIGILNSSGYTSGKTITFSFINNTGSIITRLSISYNYEKYRSGMREWDWTVAGSTGDFSALSKSYPADANNNSSYFPPLSTAASSTITGLSIPVGNTFIITWTLKGVGGNSNGQALGIDDFSLTAGFGNSYTWNLSSGTGDFTLAGNWNPSRNFPANNDILSFSNGGVINVVNVPVSETIAQLQVINNTNVTLRDAGSDNSASDLIIAGDAGTDLLIDAGSTLNFDVAASNNSEDGLKISLLPNATADVYGNIVMQNTNTGSAARPHQLSGSDASSIIFETGSIFTVNDLNGKPFGSTGTENVVVFKSGSAYVSNDGGNPFGFTDNRSKVIFNSGSLYKHQQNGQPSFAGRTYGDFEFNLPGSLTINFGSSAGSYCNIDNFTVTNGTINFPLSSGEEYPIYFNIKGNVSFNGGTFNMNPANSNGNGSSVFKLNGISDQTISGGGNVLFGANTNVIIDKTTGNVLLARDFVLNGNLLLTSGKLLINNNTLELDGTITTGTGILTGSSNSNLTIGSNGFAGILYFDQAEDNNTNALKEFLINNGASVSLGNKLNITAGASSNTFGTLVVNGVLNTNDNLILKSNAYGDAVVAESYGTVSGNVEVERYIPARRAWRFITAPLKSIQTINDAWQEGQVNTGFGSGEISDLHPGFGTEITYNNLASDGYDWNTTYNPSIRYWDPILKNFVPLPAGGTKATYVNDFPAYYFFIRGSRSIDLSAGVTAPNATTLRVTGTLAENGDNTDNIIKTTSTTIPANGYFLVGNPYASPVDLSEVLDGSRTNSSGYNLNHFWIWDPAISGTYGVGGYVAYSTGMFAPVNNPDDITGSIIQSGQGFMVQSNNTTSNSSISLEFHQEDKTVSETQVFGKQFQQTPPSFYTNLMIQSGDSLAMIDGVSTAFGKDNSSGIDNKDASKKWNTGEGIGLYRLGTWNAIEFRPVPILTDTLFYYLSNIQQHTYTLKIMTKNIPKDFPRAWLVDKYLNSMVAVTPGVPLLYNFTATNDINTFRNRFMLVFKRTLLATPVPVTKVANRANPGTIGDANRITVGKDNINLYPNPVVTGGKTIIQFNGITEGYYHITVINVLGKVLLEKDIVLNNGDDIYSLQTGKNWAAGNYLITITNENGFRALIKLVVEK
jgi:hypothetical protein